MLSLQIWVEAICVLILCQTVHLLTSNSSSNDDLLSNHFIPCEEGWILFGQHCYKIYGSRKSGESLSWQNASGHCLTLGGKLADAHSKKEYDFLILNMLLQGERNIWIGLNYSKNPNNSSRGYTSQVSFAYWSPGIILMPKNSGFEKSNCIEMKLGKNWDSFLAQWYDVECSRKLPYICQKDRNESITSPNPLFCSLEEGGGLKIRNTCYELVTYGKSWTSAEQYCKDSFKGHLATILDWETDWILNHKLSDFHQPIWIGMKLQDRLQEKWNSGWNVAYSQLPDSEFEEGSCVAMHPNKPRYWSSERCSHAYNFLCEASKDKPPLLKHSAKGWKCPQSSKQWRDLGGDFCYYFETTRLRRWHEAHLECHKKGGTLASVHSKAEIHILAPFVKQNHVSLFIGLNSQFKDDSHEDAIFTWSDGTPLNFTRWAFGEPNNQKGNCVSMFTLNMTWQVISCDERRNFICSAKKVPPKKNSVSNVNHLCTNAVSFKSVVGPITFTVLLVFLIIAVIYVTHPWIEKMRKNIACHFISTNSKRTDKPHLLKEVHE